MELGSTSHFCRTMWDKITEGTFFRDNEIRIALLDFFEKITTGIVFERGSLHFQTINGAVSLAPKHFNKQDVLSRLLVNEPQLGAVILAIWDKPTDAGTTWGLSLFQFLFNVTKESNETSNVKSDGELQK